MKQRKAVVFELSQVQILPSFSACGLGLICRRNLSTGAPCPYTTWSSPA